MAKLINYFTCNHCLFAQGLLVDFLKEAALGIPTKEKLNYIDCHYHLCIPVTEKMPEFNLRPREAVGCGSWRCQVCGQPHSVTSHHPCWAN